MYITTYCWWSNDEHKGWFKIASLETVDLLLKNTSWFGEIYDLIRGVNILGISFINTVYQKISEKWMASKFTSYLITIIKLLVVKHCVILTILLLQLSPNGVNRRLPVQISEYWITQAYIFLEFESWKILTDIY